MPFSKRVVGPTRIGRLNVEERKTVEEAGEFLAISHCALVGLLQQLTSVTKHADGIFSDLFDDCKAVLERTDAIRKRCDVLGKTVEKFNHKTEKIPQGDLTKISKNPSHHYHHFCKVETELFKNNTRPPCLQDQYDAAVLDREEVKQIHEKYRETEGLLAELEYPKGQHLDLEEKIPLLDIETRKPAILGILEKEKIAKESPWIRPQSEDMLHFMKENSNIDDLPLPTPEEALRRNAKSQPSILVPVDITGTTFDRMCEFRQSLTGSVEYIKKGRKKRRRTVSGIPGEVTKELEDLGFSLTDGPATIERSKTLDFETCGGTSSHSDDNNDFRISRGDLRFSQDDVFESVEQEEKRMSGEQSDHVPERAEKRSLRGSLRNLSCLGNRAESRSRQRRTIKEREKRSRSLPPDAQKNDMTFTTFTRQPQPEKPLERTISQDTLVSNNQTKLVRCLSFHKLRRSRSMSGGPKKKEKKAIARAKSQDFGALNTYKSADDLDHDEGIAVSHETILESKENIPRDNVLSPAERLLKKEKRKSLGRRLSQLWSNVQLRSHGNKKKPSKEDRQSSSGAWSASSESMRQSTGSGGSVQSPNRGSFKDSALDLTVPPPQSDPERVSQKGSIHGSLMDVRRNFTAMDSDAWLKQTLDERSKGKTKKELHIKNLTQANLEAHDLQTLAENPILVEDEELSVYSVDQEGFYTSMHTDSGLNKRHSLHSTLSVSAKELSDPAHYMFRSNVTIDSVIYRPPDAKKIISENSEENKSTETLTDDTPGYMSMNTRAKGLEMALPDGAMKKNKCPPPPKRVSTLSRSNLSVAETVSSESSTILGDTQMPHSLSGSTSSKLTLNSMHSESDQDSIYSRVRQKTAINTSMYPSLCSVTPLNSDDETISLRSEARSDYSDFTVSSLATPSQPGPTAPSPWSDFKSPYSTINKYKSMMKQTTIMESTPVGGSGGFKSHTLPRKMSFKQFALKENEEEKKKRWSAENKSVSSDDSGEHYSSNSWPRSPPFRQKRVHSLEGCIKESTDEPPAVPPKPTVVKSPSCDSLKSTSSGGKMSTGSGSGSGEIPSSATVAAMKPIPEIKSFSEYQDLLKDVSPDAPEGDCVTAAESMLSLSSSSSQSTGISSLSSGSGSGSEGTVPSKYKHMVTVRPKGGNPAKILFPADKPQVNLMNSVDNPPTSIIDVVKVREPIYANTPRSVQRPVYANFSTKPSIYANSVTKPNIYANSLSKPNIYANSNPMHRQHIYSNSSGNSCYANTRNQDDQVVSSSITKVTPARPELIYAISNLVKSDSNSTSTTDAKDNSLVYATTTLVESSATSSCKTEDTSSGYIQMSWAGNKTESKLASSFSSFMGPSQNQKTSPTGNLSDCYPPSKYSQLGITHKNDFKVEDTEKCMLVTHPDAMPKMSSGTIPKPFQPAGLVVSTAVTQNNKYATIGRRKLSVDANMMPSVVPSSKSSGPVVSTGALVHLARRNSSPAITPYKPNPPSRQVSVPDTIPSEPSSPAGKLDSDSVLDNKNNNIKPIPVVSATSSASVTLTTKPVTAGIKAEDKPVVRKPESNNNITDSKSINKNKGRSSLDSKLSKSSSSLTSSKSLKARASLDNVPKPKPINEMEYLTQVATLSDKRSELHRSRDSIDEAAVMDILDSIRTTISCINSANDANDEVTTENTQGGGVVPKAPIYGTTV